MKIFGKIVSLSLLTLIFTGCKDFSYQGEPHLIVSLTDAPADRFTSLTTSIQEIAIFDGSQWIVTETDTTSFDIMSYTGGYSLELIDMDVPEGTYTKMRIVFGEKNILEVKDDSLAHQMQNDQLTWETDMELVASQNTMAVGAVDLDVVAAVKYDSLTEVYTFSPAKGCRLVDAQKQGAISGVAYDIDGNAITSVIQVKIYSGEELFRSTYCSSETGRLFYRLPGGMYDIQFIPQDEIFDTVEILDVAVEDGRATYLEGIIL